MGDLTSNFSISEFRVSDSFPEIAAQIQFGPLGFVKVFYLCRTILEPTRVYLNSMVEKISIHITSGIRDEALHEALKDSGYNPSRTSDHIWKDSKIAVDFIVKNDDVYSKDDTRRAYNFIEYHLPNAFGQLIFYDEKGHCHVSLPTKKNQGEAWIKH